jgi:hypothetical protein
MNGKECSRQRESLCEGHGGFRDVLGMQVGLQHSKREAVGGWAGARSFEAKKTKLRNLDFSPSAERSYRI